MTTTPEEQYRLAVEIDHLVLGARKRGGSWGDVIQTLEHSLDLARRELDLMTAADAARMAMNTF